jgi:hypothetical protein
MLPLANCFVVVSKVSTGAASKESCTDDHAEPAFCWQAGEPVHRVGSSRPCSTRGNDRWL